MDNYDTNKVDDAVLALLHLTTFDDHGVARAWKGQDWDALDRLHQKGFISNPKGKAKSVILSEEAKRRSGKLFAQLFAENE